MPCHDCLVIAFGIRHCRVSAIINCYVCFMLLIWTEPFPPGNRNRLTHPRGDELGELPIRHLVQLQQGNHWDPDRPATPPGPSATRQNLMSFINSYELSAFILSTNINVYPAESKKVKRLRLLRIGIYMLGCIWWHTRFTNGTSTLPCYKYL